MMNTEDSETWQFARTENFTIVTFDSDFYDISLIRGYPPKIIWLRIGNATTKEIVSILISKHDLIRNFIDDIEDPGAACLEIQSFQ